MSRPQTLDLAINDATFFDLGWVDETERIETETMLLNEQPGLFIDSCATPDHPLAELMLGERMAMGDVVVSAGGRAGPAFRTANLLERLRGRARALKHRLKG